MTKQALRKFSLPSKTLRNCGSLAPFSNLESECELNSFIFHLYRRSSPSSPIDSCGFVDMARKGRSKTMQMDLGTGDLNRYAAGRRSMEIHACELERAAFAGHIPCQFADIYCLLSMSIHRNCRPRKTLCSGYFVVRH